MQAHTNGPIHTHTLGHNHLYKIDLVPTKNDLDAIYASLEAQRAEDA
jgi:hypothetical protein